MASVRDELARICDANSGELSPHAVVAAAKPRNAFLHNRFEWDNEKAGPAYRLIQATELIRSIEVEYARDEHGPKRIRQYTCTSQAGAPERGIYKRTEDVIEDPMSYQILLREFERTLADLQRRYGHLREYKRMLSNAAA